MPQIQENVEWQFRHIRQENLKKFTIVEKGKAFSVDLERGEIDLNGTKLQFTESRRGRHRLIYFRRVKQTIGTVSGLETSETDEHFGFQTNVSGLNTKRIFTLKSDGRLMQE